MIWKKKKRVDDDFDDSTPIANMNVDGMPWYVPSASSRPQANKGQGQGESLGTGQSPGQRGKTLQGQRPIQPLSRRETWSMIITAVSAALLIAFVFLLGAFLFILFALHVWLK